jgi:hypothetical protein
MAVTPSDVAITAGSGTNINTVNITNGGGTDKRQVNCVGGPDLGDLTVIAVVANTAPAGTEYGLLVREAQGAPSAYDSTAYETGHIIKASAGVLRGISGYNSGPAQWIQVHNSVTVPADTAVPLLVIKVPAQSNFSYDAGRFGKAFATGISVCNSTTSPAKTLGAADVFWNVLYS